MVVKEKKLAAIWWRVSGDDQREISPETQIREALELARQEGYEVPDEYILGTDWHSLSVWDSPPMEKLKELIRSGVTSAVFLYEADRAPSKPVHRLLFRALCQEQGVKIRCRYGQVPDGDMGEVMEFLSAWAKEKQVLRAQQGARDGLRDRARLKGLPTNSEAPYGYRWTGNRFELDPPKFPIARRIWEMAIEGAPLRTIAKILTEAGIPSPSGKPYWTTSTLAYILSNPTYKGDYVALRTLRVEPKRRLGLTYGKSTHKLRDPSEHISLPGIVSEAIVTAEEYELVQEKLAKNKAQGGRVFYSYLLRGMIRCESCGRLLRGHTCKSRGRTYLRYICGGRNKQGLGIGCSEPSVDGKRLEESLWNRVVDFLISPEVFLTAVEDNQEGQRGTVERLKASISRLEQRLVRLKDTEAKAFSEYVRGMASEEAYTRVVAELKAERAWVTEELERQKKSLEDAQRIILSMDAIKTLYPKMVERIQRATFDDKQFVLECLDAQITVGPSGVTVSLVVPEKVMSPVSNPSGWAGWEDKRCVCGL